MASLVGEDQGSLVAYVIDNASVAFAKATVRLTSGVAAMSSPISGRLEFCRRT
jgi:hypothetical protein